MRRRFSRRSRQKMYKVEKYMSITASLFPETHFHCFSVTRTGCPLVVTPREPIDFIEWAGSHKKIIAEAIKTYGAVVFSGFNLVEAQFHAAFTAALGKPPDVYKGDTPRREVGNNVYHSTAESDDVWVPPHQEVSGGDRKQMPQYISFFCSTPPQAGMGQTVVANVKNITEEIKQALPALWEKLRTTPLTYTARYLPEGSAYTRWIQTLNPSHATIKARFGSEDRQVVEQKFREEGLIYRWDEKWLVVSRSGIPGTIQSEGITLFCNQIYVDILSPKLCGGWWKYLAATTILYPTESSRQFDVQFDDGTPISLEEASTILNILEKHQVGRDWKAGDLIFVDNVATMHGKTAHKGSREVRAAMCGSVVA